MIPLLLKELRALAGVFVVAFILISGDVVSRPLSERIDENTWVDISSDLTGEGGFFAFVLMILALVVAFAAYPREHDDRTIELLHSLPVRRSTIFVAKVVAGLVVLWAAIVCGAITNGLLAWPNPESLGGEQWRLDVALTAVALRGIFATIVYGHGILVSFARRFGLIPYFLLAMIVLRLAEASPAYEVLDPSNLMAYEFVGKSMTFPVGLVALHLPLSIVTMAFAGVLWAGAGDRAGSVFHRAQRSTGGRLALGCGTAALVGIGLVATVVAFAPDATDGPEPDGEPVDYVSFETAEVETEHFHFTYPTSLEERAQGLVDRSERLYGELAEVSGVTSQRQVVVDLTDTGGGHLGIAAWTKVRIALARHRDPDDLDRTFVHELAHVLQHVESDRRVADEAEAVGFFVEGSAEFLALQVVGAGEGTALRDSRRIAAASWERHDIRFEDIVPASALRRRFDFRLEYAIGELFAAALADLHGPEAVIAVFRALGREGAPRDLTPGALLRDTFQAAGYSFEDVRSRWEERLAEIAEEERAFLDALPRLGGGVLRRDDDGTVLLVTLDRDPPPGSRITVAVRSHVSVEDTSIRDLSATPRSDPRRYEVVVPAWLGPSERFQYLPGIRPRASHWAVYETWQDASR